MIIKRLVRSRCLASDVTASRVTNNDAPSVDRVRDNMQLRPGRRSAGRCGRHPRGRVAPGHRTLQRTTDLGHQRGRRRHGSGHRLRRSCGPCSPHRASSSLDGLHRRDRRERSNRRVERCSRCLDSRDNCRHRSAKGRIGMSGLAPKAKIFLIRVSLRMASKPIAVAQGVNLSTRRCTRSDEASGSPSPTRRTFQPLSTSPESTRRHISDHEANPGRTTHSPQRPIARGQGTNPHADHTDDQSLLVTTIRGCSCRPVRSTHGSLADIARGTPRQSPIQRPTKSRSHQKRIKKLSQKPSKRTERT